MTIAAYLFGFSFGFATGCLATAIVLHFLRIYEWSAAMTKPRISILDPRFKYQPAAKTDIGRTFQRERARLKEEEDRRKGEPTRTIARLKTANGR